MEQTKEQMIADLYGLRAGLSLISQKVNSKDLGQVVIKAANGVIAKKNEEKATMKDAYSTMEELTKNAYTEYKTKENEYNERVKENLQWKSKSYGSKKKEIKKSAKESLFSDGYWAFFLLLFPILTIIGAILFPSFRDEDANISFWGAVLFGVGVGIIVDFILSGIFYKLTDELILDDFFDWILKLIPVVIFPFAARHFVKKQELAYQEAEKFALQVKDEAEKNWQEHVEGIKEGKTLLDEGTKTRNEQINTFNQLIETTDELCDELDGQALEVKKGLNEIYDSWYAESDWENVDLVIYYLESGRADTLKEALQQVDKQRQTDQIVKAINGAKDFISNQIDQVTNRMSDALVKSFSLISSQLSGISSQIEITNERLIELERIDKQVAVMSQGIQKSIDKQIDEAKLNNALLEKANVSSADLLFDVKRIGQKIKN